MRNKWPALIIAAVLTAGISGCYRPHGYRLYPDVPRFSPTHPADVELLRREPRRAHVQLGEVWIRPSPRLSRFRVEGWLREKAALMGADALVIVADKFLRGGIVIDYWRGPVPVYERHIVGVAIRYRR